MLATLEALRYAVTTGQYVDAQNLLDQEPTLGPEDEADLFHLNGFLSPANQFGLIKSLCERYLGVNPDSLNVLMLLVTTQYNSGSLEEARKSCLRIFAADPRNPTANLALGLITQSEESHDFAIDFYKKALEGDPRNRVASENLLYLLRRTGREREFLPFQESLIAWDSVLFDQGRSCYRATNTIVHQAVQSLLQTGFVVLRGAMDRHLVAQLLTLIEAYAALPNVPLGRPLTVSLCTVFELFNVKGHDETLLSPIVMEILTELFGSRPAINLSKSMLRKVRSDDRASHVPFHQDMRAFGEIGVNVWVPLTPAGGDYPGLELLSGRTRALVEVEETGDDYNFVKIAEKQFRFDEARLVAPILAPGDCILFLGDVVHRTYLPATSTGQRSSLEIRLFA
jgi:tetratricopeptide (TPR) repeat protein